MKIPDKAVIWRDATDGALFHVGVIGRDGLYRCRFVIFLHSIAGCFGNVAYDHAAELEPGKPVPLKDVLDAPGNDAGKMLDKGGEVE